MRYKMTWSTFRDTSLRMEAWSPFKVLLHLKQMQFKAVFEEDSLLAVEQ